MFLIQINKEQQQYTHTQANAHTLAQTHTSYEDKMENMKFEEQKY